VDQVVQKVQQKAAEEQKTPQDKVELTRITPYRFKVI
jgi:hypothetical protein